MHKIYLLLPMVLTGCAYADLTAPTPAYREESLLGAASYYAEFCAVSEIHQLPGFKVEVEGSGAGGHSTLYLKGVCRDKNAHYPVVQMCDAPGAELADGVGLSVNAHFENSQWVATPGRDFFYNGDLAPSTLIDRAPMTRAVYTATVNHAETLGVYDGVVFTEMAMARRPVDVNVEDYKYDVSIGTDYATGAARNRSCVRVPLNRPQMQRVIDYLNELNRPYRSGEKTFHWDLFENNCTHMVHNALAVAGVWPSLSTDRFRLFAFFDFPVPANELVDLIHRTNDMDLSDLDALYDDTDARNDLLQNGALPTAPDALVEAALLPPENDVYKTESHLIFYAVPGGYDADFKDIFSDPRYTIPRDNLAHFAALYQQLEADKKPLDTYQATHREDFSGFSDFYARFYAYIDRMQDDTEARLREIQ